MEMWSSQQINCVSSVHILSPDLQVVAALKKRIVVEGESMRILPVSLSFWIDDELNNEFVPLQRT